MSVSNFFQAVSVSVTAYGDGLKLQFGFIPEFIVVSFVSGTGPVEFSFNGDEDHGQVGNPTSGYVLTMDMKISRNEMWLKGGAGDEVVNVTAWV